jgi:heat-inducible transcriptional repressor
MKSQLTHREQKVLWATIDHYIQTAEPVGSRALVSGYDFDISPATIRNVLNTLDRSGFLYQPHTSAGRIPSDSGYRVYVNELIDPSQELTYSTMQFMNSASDRLGKPSLDNIFLDVAQILATLSGCIAVITAPNMQAMRIKHLQLVMVDRSKIMAIAVSDTYHTASVTIDLPKETNPELLEGELNILNNFLNAHLREQSWSALGNTLQWDDLDRQFQQYAKLLQKSLQQLMHLCDRTSLGQMFISGLTELLRQPEFSDLQKVQNIVQLLEADRASIMALISDQSQNDHNTVNISIGSEIAIEPMQNCAFISTAYMCDNKPIGTVAVLGPTRLGYAKAIASVQAAASHLTETMSRW